MEQTRTILIKGETVEVVNTSIEKRIPLESWLAALSKDRDVLSPILPEKCVLFSQQKEGGRCYVVQLPPSTRTVTWNYIEGCETELRTRRFAARDNVWRLSFPFCVFILKLNENGGFSGEERLFYRNEPLSSVSDRLLIPNLGNLWTSPPGKICTGQMKLERDLKTDAEKVNDYIGKFFGSPFNADLQELFYRGAQIDPRIQNVTKWAESSEAEPLFPLQVNWEKGPSLKDVLEGRG